MKDKRNRWWIRALAVCLITALAVGGTWYVATSPATADRDIRPVQDPKALEVAEHLSLAFKQVAQRVRPSLVSIVSVRHVQPLAGLSERGTPAPEIPEELRRFFGDDWFDRFDLPRRLPMPERGFRSQGMGSGVIVSPDGHILTNNHVVQGADEVTVILSDKRKLKAKVVGTDPETDLAVVQVDAHNLVPATLGNSDEVEVGDWVLALGSPFGLKETVTAGIISATGRGNVGIAVYEDFLQTDAAINPGNSGGPLVNLRGEVIGINTAIASRSGGNMGVGFAIPSNMAKRIMEQLMHEGHVDRGYLGVYLQPLTEELARSFGVDPDTKGALIGDVIPGSPAEAAGLKAGDIITRFDGRPVDSADALRHAVANTKAGSKVKVEFLRKGRSQEVFVTLGHRNEASVASSTPQSRRDQAVVEDKLGIAVAALTRERAKSLGYPENTHGVVVTRVTPGGLAQVADIRAGDIIVAVGDTPVDSVESFRQAIEKQDLAKGVRLQLLRDQIRRFVFVQAR